MTISILGAGSWSTAIANILAEKEDVLIYARDQKLAEEINSKHVNSKYFPDIQLSQKIKSTSDLKEIYSNKYIAVSYTHLTLPTKA